MIIRNKSSIFPGTLRLICFCAFRVVANNTPPVQINGIPITQKNSPLSKSFCKFSPSIICNAYDDEYPNIIIRNAMILLLATVFKPLHKIS